MTRGAGDVQERDDAREVHEQDHEEDRGEDRQEALAVLLAEQVVGDVDADEVEAHLDEALEPAGHDAACLRVPSQKTRSSATTATKRTSMIRLISNGVPSKRTAGGKNSVDRRTVEAHHRRWTIGTSRFRAFASSAISCFGAWSSALATTNIGTDSAHAEAGRKPWGIVHTLARLRSTSQTNSSRELRSGRVASRRRQLDVARVGHAGLRDDERRRRRASRSRPRRG